MSKLIQSILVHNEKLITELHEQLAWREQFRTSTSKMTLATIAKDIKKELLYRIIGNSDEFEYFKSILDDLLNHSEGFVPKYADASTLTTEISNSALIEFGASYKDIEAELSIDVDTILQEKDGESFCAWGECFTSLSLRINDRRFEHTIKTLETADVTLFETVAADSHFLYLLSSMAGKSFYSVECHGEKDLANEIKLRHSHPLFEGAKSSMVPAFITAHGLKGDISDEQLNIILNGVKGSLFYSKRGVRLEYVDLEAIYNINLDPEQNVTGNLIELLDCIEVREPAHIVCQYYHAMMNPQMFDKKIYPQLSTEHKAQINWAQIKRKNQEQSPCVQAETLRSHASKSTTQHDNYLLPSTSL